VLERFFTLLEYLQERHFEPQGKAPECVEDAWLWYRIERLERRIRWLFMLALVVPIVEAILLLLYFIVTSVPM